MRSGRYPRGDWLSVALVCAAFSHLHYMLFPTVFSDRISTGDLLLAGEDLRERLRRSGLERAALFTWEAAAKSIMASYEQALGR